MAFPITLGSRRKRKQLGPAGVAVLGTLLTLGGLAALLLGVLLPIWRERAAQAWEQVPCTILSSEVASSKRKGKTTHRPVITFQYEYAGATRVSDEYALSGWKVGGSSSAHEVVARHAPGSSAQCFVDPADPATAVLMRSIEPIWLPLGLGVVFLGLGVFLLVRVATGAVPPVKPE